MPWLILVAAAVAAFLIFKFVVKPLLKVVALVGLALVAYFWLWPLLTNSL